MKSRTSLRSSGEKWSLSTKVQATSAVVAMSLGAGLTVGYCTNLPAGVTTGAAVASATCALIALWKENR